MSQWDAKIVDVVGNVDTRVDGTSLKAWLADDHVACRSKVTVLDVLTKLRVFPNSDFPLLDSVDGVLGVDAESATVYLAVEGGSSNPDAFRNLLQDYSSRDDEQGVVRLEDPPRGRNYPKLFRDVGGGTRPRDPAEIEWYAERRSGVATVDIFYVWSGEYAGVRFRDAGMFKERHERLQRDLATRPFVYYALTGRECPLPARPAADVGPAPNPPADELSPRERAREAAAKQALAEELARDRADDASANTLAKIAALRMELSLLKAKAEVIEEQIEVLTATEAVRRAAAADPATSEQPARLTRGMYSGIVHPRLNEIVALPRMQDTESPGHLKDEVYVFMAKGKNENQPALVTDLLAFVLVGRASSNGARTPPLDAAARGKITRVVREHAPKFLRGPVTREMIERLAGDLRPFEVELRNWTIQRLNAQAKGYADVRFLATISGLAGFSENGSFELVISFDEDPVAGLLFGTSIK